MRYLAYRWPHNRHCLVQNDSFFKGCIYIIISSCQIPIASFTAPLPRTPLSSLRIDGTIAFRAFHHERSPNWTVITPLRTILANIFVDVSNPRAAFVFFRDVKWIEGLRKLTWRTRQSSAATLLPLTSEISKDHPKSSCFDELWFLWWFKQSFHYLPICLFLSIPETLLCRLLYTVVGMSRSCMSFFNMTTRFLELINSTMVDIVF